MTVRTVTATHCGARALRVLKTGQGVVLARFDSTAYLENTAGDLLAIGSATMPAGPINLCIDSTNLVLPATGAAWQYRDSCLAVDNRPIAIIDETTTWTAPAPFYRSTETLDAGLALTKPLLCQRGIMASHRSVQAQLAEGCIALNHWIEHPENQQLPVPVRAMIGCGEGLTPAGDDLLCGYLVALHALGHPAANTIADAVRPKLATLTSRISAAHLAAACNGEAVQLLHDLISAILCNHINKVTNAAAALDHYGHNSGHYAAAGVFQALTCVSQIDSQSRIRSQTG